MANPEKYRVQLDFTAEAFQELDQLKKDVQAQSRADTVRYAMRLMRWAVDQMNGGARILISKNGKISQVVFPFLPPANQDVLEIDISEPPAKAAGEGNQFSRSYQEFNFPSEEERQG